MLCNITCETSGMSWRQPTTSDRMREVGSMAKMPWLFYCPYWILSLWFLLALAYFMFWLIDGMCFVYGFHAIVSLMLTSIRAALCSLKVATLLSWETGPLGYDIEQAWDELRGSVGLSAAGGLALTSPGGGLSKYPCLGSWQTLCSQVTLGSCALSDFLSLCHFLLDTWSQVDSIYHPKFVPLCQVVRKRSK